MKKLFYWGPKTQVHPKGNRLYTVLKKVEWHIFKFFLKRFCSQDLDQWERWKLNTKYGNVYIQITRQDDGYTWDEIK